MSPHRNQAFGLILIFILVCLPIAGGRVDPLAGNSTDALSARERELLDEINLLRADPPKYTTYLEQSKKYYKGKGYKPPGQTQSLTTIEGVSAVDEAIKVLRATKPLKPYSMSVGMCSAARDHARDLGSSGKTGHTGTDGSTTESRVNRYGRFSKGIGENIIYESTSVREAVLGWLVDDGMLSRGHRKNLLSPTYRYLGVAVGEKSDHGSMCVLTFAGDFVELKTTPTKTTTPTRPTAVRKM